MAIDFPNSPTNGSTHTVGGTTWTYDGEKWNITSTNIAGPQGATGPEGGSITLTTKGDLLTRSSSALVRQGVGANDTVLIADSVQTNGIKWGTVSGTNVASGDKTGSGKIVLDTSPTLSTPNIGSATGTSLTTTGGGVLARQSANQDGVEIRGRAGGTGNWEAIITPTTLTADRTITVPDVSGTIITTGDSATVTGTMLAPSAINSQNGNYTFVASDSNKIVEFTAAATATIPASTTIPNGTSITVLQQVSGATQVSIVGASTTGLVATLSTGTAVVTLTTGSTANLVVGQTLTKTSGSGAFGANATILSIQSSTQFTASINHATGGSITFSAVVSLRSSTGTKTRTQYSVATIIKRQDGEWLVMGDTAP